MTLRWSIETYERLASTQDEMKSRLREQAATDVPEGLVIQAIEQSAGRGRQGRLWLSPPGNLYMSVLLKPACPVAQAGSLSLLICYSVGRALEALCGPGQGFQLKWPNDVLLKGKKCAGILLESETDEKGALQHVIAGIGVNLASAPAEVGIALNAACFSGLSLTETRDGILENLHEDYDVWGKEGFSPFADSWLKRTIRPGTPITAGAHSARISGAFKTIDINGNLIVIDESGQDRTFASGEIVQL